MTPPAPPAAASASTPIRPDWRRRLPAVALALILAIALAIRLHSVGFGLPALNDPDELTFELGALRLLRGPTLNPGWFGHPATTTIYVLALLTAGTFGIGYLLGWFPTADHFARAIYADPTWVMLPGRVAMVLFAVGTIYLTYRLASELFDRRTALFAAALLAVSPVHVTWSQIIRSDMMACFFMLLTLLAALRLLREGRRRDLVMASLWLGLALATKWPFAIAGLAGLGALVARAREHPDERTRLPPRMALFGALTLGFLVLASPYILLDYPTVLKNLQGEAQVHHLGATGGPPLSNAWWYLSGPILTALGMAGLILAAGGLAIMMRSREARIIILPILIGFLMVLCIQRLVWERWALPLIPLLAIAAGLALARTIGALADRVPGGVARTAAGALVALVLAQPTLRTIADAQARLNDTRQLAARWAIKHVPAGSTVLIEHFAFDLLSQPWQMLFPIGDAGCISVDALLKGQVKFSAIEAMRGGRSNVDYGTLAPATRAACRPDYAILTQYDRYAAERRTYPAEYAAYRALIAKGQLVASFTPGADRGGPVVRIIRLDRSAR